MLRGITVTFLPCSRLNNRIYLSYLSLSARVGSLCGWQPGQLNPRSWVLVNLVKLETLLVIFHWTSVPRLEQLKCPFPVANARRRERTGGIWAAQGDCKKKLRFLVGWLGNSELEPLTRCGTIAFLRPKESEWVADFTFHVVLWAAVAVAEVMVVWQPCFGLCLILSVPSSQLPLILTQFGLL